MVRRQSAEGIVRRRRHTASAQESKKGRPLNQGLISDSKRGLSEAELRQLPTAKPAFVEPMKALLTRELPEGSAWVYELKFDGVRALVIKNGNSVSLVSRAGNNLNPKYPELIECFRQLPAGQAVLDGEVAALDEQGRPSFQVLQSYHTFARKPPLLYYAFDIVNLNGKDLKPLPLWRRRQALSGLVSELGRRIRLSAPKQHPAASGNAGSRSGRPGSQTKKFHLRAGPALRGMD